MATDVAIQAASGGARWIASQTESAPSPSSPLKDRVCPHWRMAPGILCLVSSIVAVVCALIWQTPSLCAAFVPAGVCATYLIYLGWDFQNLITFAENNDRLEASVQTLESRNQELQRANRSLSEHVQRFQGAIGDLQTENGTLKTTNADLNSSLESLRGQLSHLETVRSTLQREASQHVGQLDGLHTALTGLHVSAEKDHSTFAEQLKIFCEQVVRLQQAQGSITAGTQEQARVLQTFAGTLQGIFRKIEEWKRSDTAIDRNIERLQALNREVAELAGQLGQQRGHLEVQANQIQEYRQMKEGFQTLLQQLLEAAASLKTTDAKLAGEVEKAAAAFRKYELKPPQ